MNAQISAAATSSRASELQLIVLPIVGRAMMSAIFLLSGLSKVTAPAMTIGYIQPVGLPLPSAAFVLSAFVEIVGGIALLLGYRTRAVAAVLALFSLATTVLLHSAPAIRTSSSTSSRTSRLQEACCRSSLSAVDASPSMPVGVIARHAVSRWPNG